MHRMTGRPAQSRLRFVILLCVSVVFSDALIAYGNGCPPFQDEAIVTIWSRAGLGGGLYEYEGTGFLISHDGYILTNAHVVQGRKSIVVRTHSGEIRSAEVEELSFQPDQGKDFAVIKTEVTDQPALVIGNSDDLAPGSNVCVVGYPGLLMPEISSDIGSPSATRGGVNRTNAGHVLDVSGQDFGYERLIQIDASVKPGMSGSPLLDEAGEVVGVVVGGSQFQTQPFYFAVPINTVLELIDGMRLLDPAQYGPVVRDFAIPEFKADATPHSGEIRFRDLTADVILARFSIVKGESIVLPTEVFVLSIPGLEGVMEGIIPFEVSTDKPQEVVLRVQLVDARGNPSSVVERSFEAVPPHPPRIQFVHCPEDVVADGREYIGTISFADTGGDIVRASFEVLSGDYSSFELPLRTYPEASPVFGIEEGEFSFAVATDTASTIKLEVILIDSVGSRSEPDFCEFSAREPTNDLAVSLVSPLPTSVRIGQALAFAYSIRNSGDENPGAFRTAIYLSADEAIDTRDRLLWTSVHNEGLGAGDCLTVTGSIALAEDDLTALNVEPGRLFLGVAADDLDVVAELDEANNLLAHEITVVRRFYVVPDEYPTIQAAIDAEDVQTITIAPGTYAENLRIDGAVSLVGSGHENTIVCARRAGHSERVLSIAFSPDGSVLASSSADNTVKLWDVAAREVLCTLADHTDWVESVAFSPNGALLVSASHDGTVKLWDVDTGELLRTLTGHGHWVRSVAFSPDGALLASGADDQLVMLWDVASGEALRAFSGHADVVRSVAFSPDGALLASASHDNTVMLRDTETGVALHTLSDHHDTVRSIAFSPDGALLASASYDSSVKLWNVDTGKVVHTMRHADRAQSVAFSPDGELLASASEDDSVQLWDVETGELHRALHVESVASIAFSPGGAFLAAALDDGAVKLWDVETGDLVGTLDAAPEPQAAWEAESGWPWPVIQISAAIESEVQVRGLTVSGLANEALPIGETAQGPGILVWGKTRLSVQTCSIVGHPDDGVQINPGCEVSFEACEISRNGESGIDVAGAVVEIREGRVASNGSEGVHAAQGATLAILEAEIVENGAQGVKLESESHGEITDCRIDGNERGIDVSRASVIASQSRISQSREVGVYAKWASVELTANEIVSGVNGGSSGTADRGMGVHFDSVSSGLVEENLVQGNLRGISLWGSQATVLGNDILGNAEVGILAGQGSTADIVGNRIIGTRPDENGDFGSGVHFQEGSVVSIRENTVEANAREGIHGTDSTVERMVGNVISGNARAGIQLTRTDAEMVSGNHIEANRVGIMVYGGADVRISGNRLPGNWLAGIEASGNSNVQIVDNIIVDTLRSDEGHYGTGIAIYESTDAVIEGNLILGNARDGIYSDASLLRASRNYILKNGLHGIELADSELPTIFGNMIMRNGSDGLVAEIDSERSDGFVAIAGNLIASNLCGVLTRGDCDFGTAMRRNVVLDNLQQQYVYNIERPPGDAAFEMALLADDEFQGGLDAVEAAIGDAETGLDLVANDMLWTAAQQLEFLLAERYASAAFDEEAVAQCEMAIELGRDPGVTHQARILRARVEMTPKELDSTWLSDIPTAEDLSLQQSLVMSSGAVSSFNPYTMLAGALLYVERVHAGLTETNPTTLAVEPAIAERWDVSDDSTVYTFHLRNLCFSDGGPMTADDVLFTFEDIILNGELAPLNDYGGERFAIGGEPVIERVEVVGEDVVRFELKQPYAPFLRMLDVPILPRRLLEAQIEEGSFEEAWSLEADPSCIVGLGPFQLVSVDRDKGETYERNPFYWKTDWEGNRLPYADRLSVMYVDEPYQDMLSGVIDFMRPRYSEMRDLESRTERHGIQAVVGESQFGSYWLTFNQDRRVLDWRDEVPRGGHGAVESIAFSPDGAVLASASTDGAVVLWDVATGEVLGTLGYQALGYPGDWVESIAFSPDGALLASASSGLSVLWDVATGKVLRTLSGTPRRSIAFSPDGTLLASGSSDETVALLDVATGKVLRTLDGHTDWVQSVAFSPDGTLLASGSLDDTVKVWHTGSWKELVTLPGHEQSVQSVAFSPDGTLLVSGSTDGTVKLWSVEKWEAVATLSSHEAHVLSVAFSSDGALLASGSGDNTVKLWSVESRQEILTLSAHDGDVTSVAFSPDGTLVASGSEDGAVRLWNTETGGKALSLSDPPGSHTGVVRSVAFSPDALLLASGGYDDTIQIRNAWTGEYITTLWDHDAGIESLAFSPDGHLLASASNDSTVRIWTVEGWEKVATLSGHNENVRSVAFAPDGTFLVSGSDDNTAKVWGLTSLVDVATLSGHAGDITSVAVSPDGTLIASGSDDDTVKVWRVGSWEEVATLLGHDANVTSVAFSPDGALVASGSDDETVKMWNVGSWENVTLSSVDGEIESVAFSACGSLLAAGTSTGGVRIAADSIRNLFRDARFRQAVSYAIDRTAIVEELFEGYAVVQDGPIYGASPYYAEESVVVYPHAPCEANRLLDELGLQDADGDGIRELANGQDLGFAIQTYYGGLFREIAEHIEADLEQIGIVVEIDGVSTQEMNEDTWSGTPSYDALIAGWWGTTVDPTSDLMFFDSTGSYHMYRRSDENPDVRPPHQARIDEILAAQAEEMDVNRRAELIAKFQRTFTENQDVVFLVSPLHLGLAQRDIANYANPAVILGVGPIATLFERASSATGGDD